MTKIIRDNGKVTYYYYKKKIGRHKKSGRKKNKIKNEPKKYQEWNFKIVQTTWKKQDRYIGKYHNIEEVYKAKDKLETLNKNIIFPIKNINNGRKKSSLIDYDSEYLILKRYEEGDEKVTQLKNEYGRFVDVITTSEEWFVYDKLPCLKEEHFWIYGLNPKKERKTYRWIVNTFIDEVKNETFVRVQLYNNKVLFRYDSLEFEMVICKNVSDAVRMYNLIEKAYKKEPYVIMCGMVKGHTDSSNSIIQMIQEKTGWDKKKIYRTTTRA